MAVKGRILTAAVASAIAIAAAGLSRFEGDRSTAYADSAGVWTICEGHTQGVKPGDFATPAQCAEYKTVDLADASDAVDSCVHVPITVGERAAYIDFTFNVGRGAFCGSTLVRKLNAGDHAGACEQLMRWTYAGGKQLPGLIARRSAERDLCTGKTPAN